MREPKIRFKLWTEGNRVKFQILEMDERFRGNVYIKEQYDPHVMSVSRPSIFVFDGKPWLIYLCGDIWEMDNDVVFAEVGSPREAMYCQFRIMLALEEWANTWSGWSVGKYEPFVPREYKDDGHEIFEL